LEDLNPRAELGKKKAIWRMQTTVRTRKKGQCHKTFDRWGIAQRGENPAQGRKCENQAKKGR